MNRPMSICLRDERRAAPSRPAVPSGDGAPHPARKGTK